MIRLSKEMGAAQASSHTPLGAHGPLISKSIPASQTSPSCLHPGALGPLQQQVLEAALAAAGRKKATYRWVGGAARCLHVNS